VRARALAENVGFIRSAAGRKPGPHVSFAEFRAFYRRYAKRRWSLHAGLILRTYLHLTNFCYLFKTCRESSSRRSFSAVATLNFEGSAIQYGPEVGRPRRWSLRPSSSGSRPGRPSVSEATLVESDLVSVRNSKEIASGSSRTVNGQVLRIEQPTASRRRRSAGRTPPAVFIPEALDASAWHPPDRTRPSLHPLLAPTAASPRLHSKYQSPGTHLRETVRRRAPRGQIVDCGCVEDQRMSGWSR